MSHGKMHLVVEVGAEGGSLSLFAIESLVVPEYVLTIIDQTLLFIDEGGAIEGERGRGTSWRGALRLKGCNQQFPASEFGLVLGVDRN